ncbi:GntR family transcriptional regulator [Novosphingobium mathurense]|uniref:Transcriptional regulator, GntR family n=1 Tax=Novosphingobium mathurense TaxID=428990 RepID=A0A1U6H661_9SPHN|nr:GntR family transcriptional regulator [Novosphingobium mathurense]SLJ91259.1 transcriptional regulator, GntR family [Novosphingobium mathurense]
MKEKTPGGKPARQQIVYQQLRDAIESEAFEPGALLPTEDELCATYGVTRYSLREAVAQLERQGFVERRRRAGTRVLSRRSSRAFRHVAGSRRDLLQLAAGTTVAFSTPRKVLTDGKLARELGCDDLRSWWYLEGVRVDPSDRRPIGIVRIYIDADRAPVAPISDFGSRLVYEWVAETYGIHAAGATQEINAVALTAEDAAVFDEEPGAPALRILRRYFDADQRIFQISVNTQRSTDFIYSMRIDFDD